MSFISLLAAFAGGVFGATIGGTISFIFTGIMALVGNAILVATGDSAMLDVVAFGPFFGPHIAFVGGVAASALSGVKKRQLHESGKDCGEYAYGYECTAPSFKPRDLSLLLVGGLFGVIGFAINELLVRIGLGAKGVDTIAIAVALSCLIARLTVAKGSIKGNINESDHKITGEMVIFTFVWAFSAGLLTAVAIEAIAAGTGVTLTNLGWAISAVSLVFVYTNVKEFPVSHHVTMVAALFAVATGNVIVGGLAGGLAGVAGDYIHKYINTEVKSHIDMPAVTIALGSIIAAFLA